MTPHSKRYRHEIIFMIVETNHDVISDLTDDVI